VTNQLGIDTGITIENSSVDPFGATMFVQGNQTNLGTIFNGRSGGSAFPLPIIDVMPGSGLHNGVGGVIGGGGIINFTNNPGGTFSNEGVLQLVGFSAEDTLGEMTLTGPGVVLGATSEVQSGFRYYFFKGPESTSLVADTLLACTGSIALDGSISLLVDATYEFKVGDSIVLVTAAHVLERMEDTEARIGWRTALPDGSWRFDPEPLIIRDDAGAPLWVRHPDRDVAVMEITAPESFAQAAIPVGWLADANAFDAWQVGPGDELLSLGFPRGLSANRAGFPILRVGRIASYPLSPVPAFPTFLLVAPGSPHRTLQDLLAWDKADPKGRATYGFGGLAFQMLAEQINHRSGARMSPIVYRGSQDAINAAASGDLTVALADPGPALAALDGNRARALAISTPARWPRLPEVPTVAEQGFPGLTLNNWIGMLAPAGTPAPILAALEAALAEAAKAPDVGERLRPLGMEPDGTGQAGFRAMIEADNRTWRAVAKEAGISLSR
jgi:hypothetical protein